MRGIVPAQFLKSLPSIVFIMRGPYLVVVSSRTRASAIPIAGREGFCGRHSNAIRSLTRTWYGHEVPFNWAKAGDIRVPRPARERARYGMAKARLNNPWVKPIAVNPR